MGAIIGEIATASEEQARGIDSINGAVADIDKVTQHNAANAEEGSSAAEELNSQSEELSSLIARFSLYREKAANQVAQERKGATQKPRLLPGREAPGANGANGARRRPALPQSTQRRSSIAFIPMNDDEVFRDF